MAKGSHATYGGWEAKVCSGCGCKVTLSAPIGFMFHFDHASQTGTTVCENCLHQHRDMSQS